MDLIKNKVLWEAHDQLFVVNGFSQSYQNYMVKTWNLKTFEKNIAPRFLKQCPEMDMFDFIWFEFNLNFYSKLIFNYADAYYAYCNEYLQYVYKLATPPFLILYANTSNIYCSAACFSLLNKYNKKNVDFEKRSIEQMEVIVQKSIDFLNLLDELIYPTISFKNVLHDHIEDKQVQLEFDLLNNGLGSKYYHALKNRINEIV